MKIAQQLGDEEYQAMGIKESTTGISFLDLLVIGKFFAVLFILLSRLVVLAIATAGILLVSTYVSSIFGNSEIAFRVISAIGFLMMAAVICGYVYDMYKGKLN